MEKMFGKDSCDLADLWYNELLNNHSLTDNVGDGDITNNIIEDTVESDPAPVLNILNGQANAQSLNKANDYLEPSSDSNLDVDWDIVESNQHGNGFTFADPTPLLTPAPANFSTSLPATPQSIASQSSPATVRNRKQVRNCCKAMKTWLLEQPRNLQKARQIFSQYSVEINEALRMRTPRSGRPHIHQGALTVERRGYFRSNYAIIKRCKLFIASFVNMFNGEFAATMTINDLQYPYDIEGPTLRVSSHRYTQ
uniref:Uncharacterized protein n=1 Tax=Panagrolaimus sp. ES5 TaxID=591445 RepID=A0AC34G1I8_9BILA